MTPAAACLCGPCSNSTDDRPRINTWPIRMPMPRPSKCATLYCVVVVAVVVSGFISSQERSDSRPGKGERVLYCLSKKVGMLHVGRPKEQVELQRFPLRFLSYMPGRCCALHVACRIPNLPRGGRLAPQQTVPAMVGGRRGGAAAASVSDFAWGLVPSTDTQSLSSFHAA